MKKKELSRMRRTELISLVRAQKRENERLKKGWTGKAVMITGTAA